MKLASRQTGSAAVVAALITSVVLLVGTLGFGLWAYSGRQDYKDNVQQKVATAVTQAKHEESTRKDTEFAELSKSPLKTYVGPEAYGSINLKYPKTWSGYVATSTDNAPYIDGYFSPGVVPSVDADNSTFALRVRVNGDSYSSLMEAYSSRVEDGTVKISPYKLPKVSNVIGSKVVGQLDQDKKGTLIILPLRANALEIWTESDKNLNDFSKYILPNLSFSP
jgi:Flp pilus assembly protein TadG